MNDPEAMKSGEEQYVVTYGKKKRYTCLKADAADKTKIHEAVPKSIDVFEK